MSFEHYIYLIVFVLWAVTIVQGIASVRDGVRFYRYIERKTAEAAGLRDSDGRFLYQPKAAVILPCCGVDEKLEQTVGALGGLNYDDYEIVFTFESDEDAAYEAIGRWTRDWEGRPFRLVVAGLAESRAQKIHNLLAAVEAVGDDREVLVFLDSDAVPRRDWLGDMVAPLREDSVGAATGYRWYVATGGLAAGLRCGWNAATVSMLADEKLNFCWGGSTAIRRDLFESLEIARYWERAVSDDLQLTRAIRDAGLLIRFVPRALIPNTDRTGFLSFWRFAKRQVIITRICGQEVWRSGLVLCVNFVAGGTAVAALFFVSLFGRLGSSTVMYAALAGWILVVILAAGKPALRQMALRLVLKPPDLTWRDFVWDVAGTPLLGGTLHLNLIVASLWTRRIRWRNTEYELISADQTRVVRRIGSG